MHALAYFFKTMMASSRRCASISPNPPRRPPRQTQSLSPFALTDKRKTRQIIPDEVLNELLYVYVNALTTKPPLIGSIGPFLNETPSLYPDRDTKTRLGKKISDWDRSDKQRESPSDKDAPKAAAYVKRLKLQYWSHRGHDDYMSDSGDVSDLDIESPPPTPKKLASTNKASTKKKPPVRRFLPEPASFIMAEDPPTDNSFAYGFSSSELGLDYDTIHRCNRIYALDPQDPSTFPNGYIAWEDRIKVRVQGTDLLKDRVAVLIEMPSAAAATEVTTVKLEKSGHGFMISMCAQDPHFASEFEDIKEEVAAQAGATEDDPDGTLFADRVSKS